MELPSVHGFMDYREFLRAWFEARKAQEPGYSHAVFAAEAGCSKSTLSNVLGGARRPRPGTLDAFARGMGLSPSERNHLGLLVELAGAQDQAGRRVLLERILAADGGGWIRRAEEEASADTLTRFLSHWYVPVVMELSRIPGFRGEAAWVARALRPTVSETEADHALETLLDMGFLVRDESGQVVPGQMRFETGIDAHHPALTRFYREILPGMLRALDTDLNGEQHLMAATLVLSPAAVKEAKAEVAALVKRLATLADDPEDMTPASRVYQFAVQLVPVSANTAVDDG